ncbi:MAG TPA: formate dehydrogenase accessory sulfurtransferase FdhD [Spirochaetota bacterium]|jgi:formate dehydrogenase accessory protein FdhD|nr:MAG: formate dehydrogenase accessory protein [Spirochaetes bacterium ADurb.Bin133]HNZ28191.1 formate dehydrogenase accessory sulfurtransferase FdhD [Spirochaetota bacterium]HPY88994.1 formate dehydrogenase accessory sulfurtransferase FdhD [Spirochaetota bacterium]HQB62021.1 formate dehydrogenase accessory sulfurtransferase FdhD [Spirochaetota bacterium]
MNYKEIKAFQYKNGITSQINEKLIKEEFLRVYINNIHIEDILTIEEDIELLALGNYFHCIDSAPDTILNNVRISDKAANITLESADLDDKTYKRNLSCSDGLNAENKNIFRLNCRETTLYPDIIFKIKSKFEEMSRLFKETAGVHSASIFDENGDNLGFFIDIARRNCLSKATGYLIKNKDQIKDKSLCIMISSRVNSETIKMFDKLGVSTLITKAAPSFDSVIESEKRDITLIGFLKEDRFTVFCGNGRVITR